MIRLASVRFLDILVALLLPVSATAASKFQEYILAPSDRSLSAVSVYNTTGNVQNSETLLDRASTQGAIFGTNSSITLDFGKNIAGTVSFDIYSVHNGSAQDKYVGFSFTESSQWISPYHSDATQDAVGGFDAPLWFPIPQPGSYAADKTHQRGSFRYLSVWHNSSAIGDITLGNLRVNFTASPDVEDPSYYPGYFNSDNEKLNRVWYAGAYTNQLCIIDPAYGNALGLDPNDWQYNTSIANGTSALSDGAKRDRLIWPGDIIISGPSIFVSTNSLDSIKNGIDSLFLLQTDDGRLPWAGTPFVTAVNFRFSFTYHLYTLLDVHRYYIYTGDLDYLTGKWEQYKRALAYSVGTIDDSNMANVTSANDWLRSGMGGHNVEANSILYHTLESTLALSAALNDTVDDDAWKSAMEGIKSAINERLWDPSQNLFFDNDMNQTASAVRPQDGNSWAVIAGVVDSERASAISTSLQSRWVRPYGAPAPEAGVTVSPFVSGFELQAHFLAGFPERAIDLIEFMYADFMLDDPRMTNSSFIEGYSIDGALHYPPYQNDPRVSHAHGWATGPTASLTFFLVGLQVTSAEGKTWSLQPRLGGQKHAEAGFITGLGDFSASWTVADDGTLTGTFEAPAGTTGTVTLPSDSGSVVVEGAEGVISPAGNARELRFEGLVGGKYSVSVA